MLNELSRYENLGTPCFFYELFKNLSDGDQPWTTANIKDYFYGKIIENQSIFDGCLPLAQAIGAVNIDSEGVVNPSAILIRSLSSENHFSFRLLELIFGALKGDEAFHQIFCSENISYDIIYKQIQIESAAFRFRYANLRHLLIHFAFLQIHPDEKIRKLIINPKFKKLFDKELLPEIKKRKIGIGQLEKLLAQKQIYGKEAERFVLNYEQKRLAAHEKFQNIEIVSEYDVAAGYDIVSYDNLSSKQHDRFIEVKSYSGVPSFHWSRNEIDVSRRERNQYFLYLVDRSQCNNENYFPLIIQNPYEHVLDKPAKWTARVEEYFVTCSTNL